MNYNFNTPIYRIKRRGAFTLLELIIVAAIIALLLSLVLLAMGGVTSAGNRAASSNALRNMMRAYLSYSSDHDQKLMPGYIDPTMIGTGPNQLNMYSKLPNGKKLNEEDSAGYVWRLMPYLDEDWKTLLADYREKSVEAKIDEEIFRGDESGTGAPDGIYGPGTMDPSKELGLGLQPAFGLNSLYLGGDSYHGGSTAVGRNPWQPAMAGEIIAATRMSEVLNTSRLIVFAPNKQANDSQTFNPAENERYGITFGYPELRAPYLVDDDGGYLETYWSVNADEVVDPSAGDFTVGGGVPFARWGRDQIPTGRLDGSTSTVDMSVLGPPVGAPATPELVREIMTHWWPFATGYQ